MHTGVEIIALQYVASKRKIRSKALAYAIDRHLSLAGSWCTIIEHWMQTQMEYAFLEEEIN